VNYRYTVGGFLAWLEARGVVRPDGVKASHVRA